MISLKNRCFKITAEALRQLQAQWLEALAWRANKNSLPGSTTGERRPF